MQIDHKEIVEGESTLICNRCILPNSFPRINFDEQGVCSICRDYNRDFANWRAQLPWKRKVLNKICKEAKAKHKEYDALIPLSGGKDSTYVLYVAHKELGLKCLYLGFRIPI